MSHKICSRCETFKSHDKFSLCTRAKDGKQSYCQSCNTKYSSKYRDDNPNYGAELFEYNMLNRYKITVEEYVHMRYIVQENRCAACDLDFKEIDEYKICVDHSHETGLVCGILCNTCNVLEAQFHGDRLKRFLGILHYHQRTRRGRVTTP